MNTIIKTGDTYFDVRMIVMMKHVKASPAKGLVGTVPELGSFLGSACGEVATSERLEIYLRGVASPLVVSDPEEIPKVLSKLDLEDADH